MKYITLLLVGIAAAQKKCNKIEPDKPCPNGFEWNQDGCACFSLMKCKMMCPDGQKLSELETCKCIPSCEYEELTSDQKFCQVAKTMKEVPTGTAQEGETCEGFDERTGEPFPYCAAGLDCKRGEGDEVTIPGADKKCVEKGEEMQESGSLFGYSVAAVGLAAISLL